MKPKQLLWGYTTKYLGPVNHVCVNYRRLYEGIHVYGSVTYVDELKSIIKRTSSFENVIKSVLKSGGPMSE